DRVELGAARARDERHRTPSRRDFRWFGLRIGRGALGSHDVLLVSFDDGFASVVTRSLSPLVANPRRDAQPFVRARDSPRTRPRSPRRPARGAPQVNKPSLRETITPSADRKTLCQHRGHIMKRSTLFLAVAVGGLMAGGAAQAADCPEGG